MISKTNEYINEGTFWFQSFIFLLPMNHSQKWLCKLTLRVCANGVCPATTCCWIAVLCSDMPFWNAPSICSNIVLHDCSKDGIIDDSKLERKASCMDEVKSNELHSNKLNKNKTWWLFSFLMELTLYDYPRSVIVDIKTKKARRKGTKLNGGSIIIIISKNRIQICKWEVLDTILNRYSVCWLYKMWYLQYVYCFLDNISKPCVWNFRLYTRILFFGC